MSYSRTSVNSPFGRSADINRLKSNIDWLHELPDPPETFRRSDIPEGHRPDFDALLKTPAIEHDHQVLMNEESHPESYYLWEYTLHPWVVETVEDWKENRDAICPCGHSGLRNKGSYYECCFDGCPEKYSRDELLIE